MVRGKFTRRRTCRLCNGRDLKLFLNLEMMPLAGDYLTKEKVGKEKFYPLEVWFCQSCSLVQVLNVIGQDTLFFDYRYLSSSTVTLSNHFADFANEVTKKFLKKGDKVLEIGSNDGVLLKPLKKLGIKAIGIDPARNVNMLARKQGLEIVDGYFNRQVALGIKKKFGKVRAVFANNCLAHINDLDEVFLGINSTIEDKGILIFEVHYIVDLLKKFQFDTIYHEHLCYYSLTSLQPYLKQFGFEIFDVKRIPIHSGSIRVYAQKEGGIQRRTQNLTKLLRLERRQKVTSLQTYTEFAKKVEIARESITQLINKLKKEGKRIVGYGAAGRGNILLNYCKLDFRKIDYLVDESPERIGRFAPGAHIPIYALTRFRAERPDYALILAWSYLKEITNKEKVFLQNNGKFIVPLPRLKVVKNP